MTGAATISDCGRYRYSLTRDLEPNLLNDHNGTCVFVMLNPSTADAFIVDPTVRRCLGFAKASGHGGLYVLNAFALRSTDPRALYTAADPVGPLNDTYLASIDRQITRVGQVCVGWGAERIARERGQRVYDLLAGAGHAPLALGVTKDGYPRHPLYVRSDVTPAPWTPQGR